jgi:ribonuclease BN (tRNA processing enzyme)
MQLTVLGAGPAYTSRRGAAGSSYLLQQQRGDEVASLVLDLGQGSFANLAATVEPSSVAALLVSHLHPDHFVDLVSLRHYLKWEFEPSRRIRVVGPSGLSDRIDGLEGETGFTAASLDVDALPDGKCEIGPFTVAPKLVTHTEESYAFRVSIGNGSSRGLVYSGDCSNPADLLPLIHPGDTVLCEASFGAGPVAEGAEHMSSGDAGLAAAKGGAGQLLLTHVLPGHSRAETLAAARAVYGGPVQLVTEGDTFEI